MFPLDRLQNTVIVDAPHSISLEHVTTHALKLLMLKPHSLVICSLLFLNIHGPQLLPKEKPVDAITIANQESR
jgi:hypothetical protein